MSWLYEFEPNWVFWLVLGLGLLAIDTFAGTAVMVWLGLGALVVAATDFFLPDMALLWKSVLWIFASVAFIGGWLYAKRVKVGDRNRQMVGVSGVIVEWDGSQGRIRFQRPYGHGDVWEARSQQALSIGARAKVTAVDAKGKFVTVEA